MGGKALAVSRMNLEEHSFLSKIAIEKLASNFPSIKANCVPSYFSKSDFGDLDVLVEDTILNLPGGLNVACENIAKMMGATEWIMNCATKGQDEERRMTSEQGVLSMSIPLKDKSVQLDFVVTSPATYQTALDFLSFNMLGNLISSQAHLWNMAWGASGLIWEDPEKKIPKIIVTQNTKEAFEFLGYDFERFKRGFNTLRDIFDYASSPEGFDPQQYDLSRKTSKERRRDAIRVNYMAFLDYLKENNFPIPDERNAEADLEKICAAFPQFGEKLDTARLQYDIQKRLDYLVSRSFFESTTGLDPDSSKLFRAEFINDAGGIDVLSKKIATLSEEEWVDMIKSKMPVSRRPLKLK